MNKKRRVVIILAASTLMLGAILFFSFFTILSCWSFEEVNRLGGDGILLRPDSLGGRSLGPRNFRIIETTKFPCDLIFEFSAVTGTVQTVSIDRLTIQYSGESSVEVVDPPRKKTLGFKTNTHPVLESNGLVYHQTLFAQGRISNCITKAAPLVIACDGYISDSIGKTNLFSIKRDFRPQKVSGIVPTIYLEVKEEAPPGYPLP